jgi:hypothetical protein
MSDIRNTLSQRREFIKKSIFVLAALPFMSYFIASCTKKSGTSTPPDGAPAVKEDDPVAASLGYKEDVSKVDTEKFPKRKGPEGEKQFCHNCQFYVAKGDSGWGTCQILRTGDVKDEGWCNTWAAKAAG